MVYCNRRSNVIKRQTKIILTLIATIYFLFFSSILLAHDSIKNITQKSYATLNKIVGKAIDGSIDKDHSIDEFGTTPLIWAAFIKDTESVRKLLKMGANPNKARKDGVTALFYASLGNFIEIMKLLIEKGAIVDKKDKDGMTALMIASFRGRLEAIKLLLREGAAIEQKNNSGDTPLMIASFRGRFEAVKLLLEKGANPNKKDNDGFSAIDLAQDCGCQNCIKLLENYQKISATRDLRGAHKNY